MSGGSSYGPGARAVEALYAFLSSAKSETSPPGYNDVLGAWRTAQGLTQADIANVAVWERYRYRGDKTTAEVYAGITIGDEIRPAPEAGPHDRLYAVPVEIGLIYFVGSEAEADAQRRGYWYGDRFVELFERDTEWPDGAGDSPVAWHPKSLNGFDDGRIYDVRDLSYQVGEDKRAKRPNGAVVVSMTILTAETRL